MNKKMGLLLLAALTVCFSSCYKKQLAELSFRVRPLDGGKSVEVTSAGLSIGVLRDSLSLGLSQTVNIPSKLHGKPVTAIGSNVFEGKGLINVTIPGSVKTIGEEAFAGNMLTSLTIPGSVTEIGNAAFAKNQLTSVKIPNKVKTIGTEAFWDNQLTSVSLPGSVTEIGDWAFQANQLAGVTIPKNVTTIGAGAFYDNQITGVTIPNSVTTIGAEAFAKNPLTAVTIAADNPTYTIKGSFLLSKDGSQLILYFGSDTDVTIPDGITTIGAGAFSAKQLASVTIPDGVILIENRAFRGNQLTAITLPDSVTTIGDRVFQDNPLASITIGANVTLGTQTVDNYFEYQYGDRYYYGRAAGTYVKRGSSWSRQ